MAGVHGGAPGYESDGGPHVLQATPRIRESVQRLLSDDRGGRVHQVENQPHPKP